MAKNFSKFLGKIALMTAAALWAACNDSDKKAEDPKSDTKSIVYPIKLKKGELSKIYRDSIPVKKLKPDLGGFMQNQTVALYGVLPDVVHKGDDGKVIPRCRIKPLSAKNIVVEGRDIDVQTFLKVYRQRVHGLRFIFDKNVRRRSDLASEFEGRIVLTLKIASSGEVENVQIKSTTIAENSPFSAINEEVKESVSHWKFPKTKNGATFSFPISFYGELPQPSMFDDSSSVKNK
ncbi:MAG: AgmX/PglI C-terminal domain-containing protein [Fibrobacter sp.]|uniref:AgmX/PglI C-terminal domain-containing protein n=1 Tax=Fibrobacter sp. TaxID=35828 RepID=UPI0025C38DD7|nr:AgmX/PglI C-terminal domain-containing protein [Fibrobacter sp.]MBQ9226683.1 AgmX/PglI C-terminal domain-containing protein [Fibrobacter sp.]MBR1745379.1 AgmX/PglI C-terminal domain-containing protein [Fibrobacter sp.]